MLLVSLLPDVVFHLVFLVGLLALVTGYLLTAIPFVGTNARTIQVAGIVLTVVGVWFEGGISRDAYYQEKIAKLQTKIAQAETLSAEANEKLAEQLLTNKQLTRDNVAANKGRMLQQAPVLNQTCKISDDVIVIINDAARNSGGTK